MGESAQSHPTKQCGHGDLNILTFNPVCAFSVAFHTYNTTVVVFSQVIFRCHPLSFHDLMIMGLFLFHCQDTCYKFPLNTQWCDQSTTINNSHLFSPPLGSGSSGAGRDFPPPNTFQCQYLHRTQSRHLDWWVWSPP